jgi:hypothetical protein
MNELHTYLLAANIHNISANTNRCTYVLYNGQVKHLYNLNSWQHAKTILKGGSAESN